MFYTPWGLYCFNTLVMGTAPASSECHERIRIILEGLEGVIQIKDDLVVHGKGQVHDDRLEKVLQRLMEYGLTLRKDKCQFGVEEVIWFGMVFSKQGMSPDPEKVKTIQDWPVPEDKAAVKQLSLGIGADPPPLRSRNHPASPSHLAHPAQPSSR